MNIPSLAKFAFAPALMLAVALPPLIVREHFRGLPPLAAAAETAGDKTKADNKACYVCHPGMKNEKITAVHLAAGHGCTECHGPSIDHFQDEMQMTTPDVLYGRTQVDAMCGKCHEDSHEDVEKQLIAFMQKWGNRSRENGRTVSETSICTDCHGTHNIHKKADSDSAAEAAAWQSAFNGTDLTGWTSSGSADWKIKLGRIVGTPGAEGAGDLLSDVEYADYQAAITFRADFPIHAGFWLRAADVDRGPRVEVFEHHNPTAFTGSVGLPGRQLIMLNVREDLFDTGGWNTLAVEVRGDRVATWLNGEEIGAVCCDAPEKGRIGLHLKGGPGYERAQISVREVQIQRLPDLTRPDRGLPAP